MTVKKLDPATRLILENQYAIMMALRNMLMQRPRNEPVPLLDYQLNAIDKALKYNAIKEE